MTTDGPVPISEQEVVSHLEYAHRVLKATAPAERGSALSDQLLTFAHRSIYVWGELASLAPQDQKDFYQGVLDEVIELYVLWMKGSRLTNRPDEPERRALAGKLLLEERSDMRTLYHYAAQSILELPEGHALRDLDLVRRVLHDQVAWLRQQSETPWVAVAGALGILYRERLAADAELQSWRPWAREAVTHLEALNALRLLHALEGYCLERHDEDPGAGWLDEAHAVREAIAALPLTPRMRAESCLAAARLHTRSDNQRPIAELYRQALDTGALEAHVDRLIATREARLRSGYHEDARVVELLFDRLADYERAYVEALRDEDRGDRGRDSAEATALLAFALARLDRWREAVEAIEGGKCLRQRHTVRLRGSPEAAALLAIEGELYGLSRGLAPRATLAVERVRDWLAAGLTPEAQLLAEYRKVLPALAPRQSAAGSVADMAATLRAGEGALSLGIWWTGLFAALLAPGHDTPVWTLLREDLAQKDVMEWLAGNETEGEGFLLALERGIGMADPRPPLRTLLERLDRHLAVPVAAAMRAQGLTRLVVLPHNVLRLAPLWALPAWDGFEVRMAPGAFALAADPRAAFRRRALVVSNPTADLPLARTEVAIAADGLTSAQIAVTQIDGAAATEAALVRTLPDVGLFHFAGHGIASLADESLSALLVAPDWTEAPVSAATDLLALEGQTIDGARFSVDREEGSPRRKLYYEYARFGTLYAECEDDRVLIAGELWRVGDLLVQGTLRACGLAFLSACSSGLGAIPLQEEASGLPAALDVAGVRCVVSSGWPVADEVALLFAAEFYARALAPGRDRVEVVSAVREASRVIGEMTRDEAVRRLAGLAAGTGDRGARFRLNVFARRVAAGADRPFADPFDSRAFFVTGAAHIDLEARSA